MPARRNGPVSSNVRPLTPNPSHVTIPAPKIPIQKPKSQRKPGAKRVVEGVVFTDKKLWVVQHGSLQPTAQIATESGDRLFQVVGEKLPYSSLQSVRQNLRARKIKLQGVYVAHDSMGCSRYVGRGAIFPRLAARKKAHPLELEYYSFYVVQNKNHEREIETLLIRAAGFLLEFNSRKKRVGIAPGNIQDYEAGTVFIERRRDRTIEKMAPKKRRAVTKEA